MKMAEDDDDNDDKCKQNTVWDKVSESGCISVFVP